MSTGKAACPDRVPGFTGVANIMDFCGMSGSMSLHMGCYYDPVLRG